MPICLRGPDLATDSGSPLIVKVIGANLENVALALVFGKAICQRGIDQDTRLIVECVVLRAQIIHQLGMFNDPFIFIGASNRALK